jgi:hypothetical protein
MAGPFAAIKRSGPIRSSYVDPPERGFDEY